MGKSSDANMIAKKIHQPANEVTKVKAPPAYASGQQGGAIINIGEPELTTMQREARVAAARLVGFSKARARLKKAPARQPKAQTNVKKMTKKTMLVRREQIMKMKQIRPGRVSKGL